MLYSPCDGAAGTVSSAAGQRPDLSLYEYVISNFDSDHVLNRLVTTYRETLGDDVALTGRSLKILNRVLAISLPQFSPQMYGAESSSPSAGQRTGSFTRESSESSCARTSKQPARFSRHQAESLALSKEQIETYLSNLIERPWEKEYRGHHPDKTCNLCTLICRPGREFICWTDEEDVVASNKGKTEQRPTREQVASDKAETEHWITRQRDRPGSIVAFNSPSQMTADEHVIMITLHHTLNGWRSHSPSEFPYLQSLIENGKKRDYGNHVSFCNEPWATSVMHTHYHLTKGDLTEDGVRTEEKNASKSGGIPPVFYRTSGDDMLEAMSLVKSGLIGSLWEYKSKAQLEEKTWVPFFDLMLVMEQVHTEKRRPVYNYRMIQERAEYERRTKEGHKYIQADFPYQR